MILSNAFEQWLLYSTICQLVRKWFGQCFQETIRSDGWRYQSFRGILHRQNTWLHYSLPRIPLHSNLVDISPGQCVGDEHGDAVAGREVSAISSATVGDGGDVGGGGGEEE